MSFLVQPVVSIVDPTIIFPCEMFSTFSPAIQAAVEERCGRRHNLTYLIQTVFQVTHTAHFIIRRVEQILRLERDPFSLFVGATLELIGSSFVRTTTKVIVVVERVIAISKAIQRLAQSFSLLIEELQNDYPFPLEHMKYQIGQYEGPLELSIITELSIYFEDITEDFLLKLEAFWERMIPCLSDFISLSRAFLDLYDTLAFSSGDWEYYEVTHALRRVVQFIEEQPSALLKLLETEEQNFVRACDLVKLDVTQVMDYLRRGAHMMERGMRVVKSTGATVVTAAGDISSLLKIVA